VRLEEHQIALELRRGRAKKVVEAHLKQIGRAGIAGNVAAQLTVRGVGLDDHGQRVPAHDGRDALLQLQMPRKRALVFQANGVGIGRDALGLPAHAQLASAGAQAVKQVLRPYRPSLGHQLLQRLKPLAGFLRIRIGRLEDGQKTGQGEVGHG
jgi:hypothetical protein